jgi:hypothetical protein
MIRLYEWLVLPVAVEIVEICIDVPRFFRAGRKDVREGERLLVEINTGSYGSYQLVDVFVDISVSRRCYERRTASNRSPVRLEAVTNSESVGSRAPSLTLRRLRGSLLSTPSIFDC